jgi:leader peptidase (prepilin peptidase) / N-methyltransferase
MHYVQLGTVASVALGAASGLLIVGMADHFTFNRSLWPTPVCPHCGKPQARGARVPWIGALLSQGRCGTCDKRSSWRLTIIVQIIAAILALLLYRRYGWSDLYLCAAVESFVLLAVALIDFQHRLIPTLLVYPTVVFAIAFSPAWPNLGILSSLLGGALGFVVFLALAALARIAFGEGALGGGDVTLAALIGAMCGYPLLVLALAMGALFGGIGAITMVAIKRSALGTTIPYGPYLVAGVLYVLVNGGTMHPLFSAM